MMKMPVLKSDANTLANRWRKRPQKQRNTPKSPDGPLLRLGNPYAPPRCPLKIKSGDKWQLKLSATSSLWVHRRGSLGRRRGRGSFRCRMFGVWRCFFGSYTLILILIILIRFWLRCNNDGSEMIRDTNGVQKKITTENSKQNKKNLAIWLHFVSENRSL